MLGVQLPEGAPPPVLQSSWPPVLQSSWASSPSPESNLGEGPIPGDPGYLPREEGLGGGWGRGFLGILGFGVFF